MDKILEGELRRYNIDDEQLWRRVTKEEIGCNVGGIVALYYGPINIQQWEADKH